MPRVERGVRPSKDDRTARRARTFTPPDPLGKVVIQFGYVDVGGPWCLSKITPSDHIALLNRIRSFETMTTREAALRVRRDERFYALWWDPEHTIWPSQKR